MSIKYTAAVWEDERITNYTELLVALALADYANDDTGECCPSFAVIVRKTLLSKSSVKRCLLSLERKGVIKVEHRMTDQEFSSSNYILTPGEVSENEISLWLPASQWAELRATVFERDGYSCVYCGYKGSALECDHSIPLSRGGDNSIENLVTACRPCNLSKGAKLPGEWNGGVR
jgi:HNH endonuclease/Helix-turn-helix domain